MIDLWVHLPTERESNPLGHPTDLFSYRSDVALPSAIRSGQMEWHPPLQYYGISQTLSASTHAV